MTELAKDYQLGPHLATADDVIEGRARYVDTAGGHADRKALASERTCHCGQPVEYGYDGDPTHHRGMCQDCDAVRCDAYPLDCPHRRGPRLGADCWCHTDPTPTSPEETP